MQLQGGSSTDSIINFNSILLFSLLEVTMDYGHVDYVHHNFDDYGGPQERIFQDRVEPFNCTDLDFWARYRFRKESVRRLAELVFPIPFQGHGKDPFDWYQVTCAALHNLAGGSFQRVDGLCAGGSKSTVHRHLYKFLKAFLPLKPRFIHMPTREMMEENARLIQE